MVLILADSSIYSISYNEFNRNVYQPSHFYKQFIYCGALPIHGEKEIFEIGTNSTKICSQFNALQVQKIYDCR